MKKIISIFALPITCLLPSASKSNGSIIRLTGLEIAINQNENNLRVLTRISVPYDTKIDCYFLWHITKDKTEDLLYQLHTMDFDKCTNAYIDVKPKVSLNELGTNNKISVSIYPKDTGYQPQTIQMSFNLKGEVKVNFKESDNNVGVSSGFYIKNNSPLDPSKNAIMEDRITFTNFEDLVIEEKYLNFDISRFEFNYSGNTSKSYLDGEFIFGIYDKYNLLSDLPLYGDSLYRYIPLKITSKDNGNNSFVFKNKIYYDPVTHNPSLYYKENYVETDKLYFPLEEVEKLKSNKCMLLMNINGYTKFTMSGDFDLRFMKNYFGDCSDSEYCVENNYDEGDNVREKVVEVKL